MPTAARRREFQSTLPVWGATNVQVSVLGPGLISIHAPRVGSDGILTGVDDGKGGFQSTLPVWGATLVLELQERRGEISIHAPRVGSDAIILVFLYSVSSFQSTLPVWGATGRAWVWAVVGGVFQSTLPVWGATFSTTSRLPEPVFQSTLPVWGATYPRGRRAAGSDISIHAPRVGSDGTSQRLNTHHLFQSTLPVWGAT